MEREPEPAVRPAPGTERGRGVVAGIDVDEHCTVRVQCDRQLEREAGISLPKYLWDNDLATRYGLRVSPGVSEGRKPYYPLGLRQKRRDLEARPQHDRLPTLSGAQGAAIEENPPGIAGIGRVCRIHRRGIYRALGAEDIRHRRIASKEVLMPTFAAGKGACKALQGMN